MNNLTKAQQFFYDNAGYSYDPATETQEEGHIKCAIALAKAEEQAAEEGFSFRWELDPYIDSSDFNDDGPPYALWECIAYNPQGIVIVVLGAVDFGKEVAPWESPYRRVIEAELSLGAIK